MKSVHEKYFYESLEEHIKTLNRVSQMTSDVVKVAQIVVDTVNNANTVFTCGNGGSASDAQHFSGELVGRFETERRAFASICLNTDTSTLTAISNDYGYDQIFARQISGLASRGDLLFAISTSGQSKNVVEGVKVASELGLRIVVLTSEKCPAETFSGFSNITTLRVPSKKTAYIQEAHIFLIHFICRILDYEVRNA